MAEARLFDEQTLRRLERLSLVARQVRVGVLKGERRSRRRGSAIEFADYRDYSPGDDLRRLDWNVFARLERPFIKLLEEEEDLAIHVLLDGSASMDWPPDGSDYHKMNYALRVTGALAYIGLVVGDQVTVTVLHSAGNRSWGPFRGRQSLLPLLQFLESVKASGPTQMNQTLRAYALHARRPGLLFLISDLFSPGGYRQGFQTLMARGYELVTIQPLSPDEVNPAPGGDVRFVDVETAGAAELTLDQVTVDRYRERLFAWQAEIAAYLRDRGGRFVSVETSLPWERLVLQTLRIQSVVE
ncbi:MAG: DUF58 domain-containing protein [Candidatus Promineifilaceae bacterium]|nr:DUF58 domain-containing protein [Candidatus Promineifilaceae bacterium]